MKQTREEMLARARGLEQAAIIVKETLCFRPAYAITAIRKEASRLRKAAKEKR